MTSRFHDPSESGDSLDLLTHQDGALMALFDDLDESQGPAVLSRYNHGNQSKRLIRHIALREAAKSDLVHTLGDMTEFASMSQQLVGRVEERRKAINMIDVMGRGVRPIDLNKTQDFDAAIEDLRRIVVPEINWELAQGLPALGQSLSQEQRARLRSARFVRRHAPTKLDPGGFRQRERRRVVSWILTRWDHLLDRPRPVRGARVD